MAGLKETMFADGPVVFWSFDEDIPGFEGNQILDELNNANPLIIHGDKYTLGNTSMNDLELSDQSSIKVAENGKYATDWTNYVTYFECVHSTAFNFPNRGSFSIEFLYYKDSPDNIKDYGKPGYYKSIVSPIIQKGSTIRIEQVDAFSGSDYLRFKMFNGSRYVDVTHSSEYNLWGRINHVVCTYDVIQTDVNEYQSIMKIYLNGRHWGTDTADHVDSWPNTAVSDSWLLAGDGGNDVVTDFQSELLWMDQVAVYPYALTWEEVSRHYTKTKHYDKLIKDDGPNKYWRLDELQDPQDYTLYADVGGINGQYFGQVNRYNPGPDKLIEARSVHFSLGASASIENYSTYGAANTILDVNDSSYTLEFWFKSGDNSDRGPLIYCVEENPGYDSLIVWLNSKDNAFSPGNIQVSESLTQYVNSLDLNPISGERNNWNDNNWHHVVVRRTGGYLQLWIDGQLDNEVLGGTRDNNRPSQLHLMGSAPGDRTITGYLSEIAWYTYALQEMQIMSRWLFTTRYKVGGYTLLQGNPVSATVRFYDHTTGDLMGEVKSDSITGEYSYEPATNRYLDVLSFIPDNKTTRYRVHGPVKPAEYDDSHLIT